jgi:site-specific DNA recombinase
MIGRGVTFIAITRPDDTDASPVIHSVDSTLGGVVESIGVMKEAVLYARVSTDAQEKEGTIQSQVFELKRQIAAAGHDLVKEYIEDGYTGTLLDRPALNQLRADLKTEVYFLCADRIARAVAYQTIIVDELLKHGKQIIINGKDYEQNPENKLTLTMLGAFAEYERAKIMERMVRGKLHRLRMGEMSSNGHRIYGYRYVKKILYNIGTRDIEPDLLPWSQQHGMPVMAYSPLGGLESASAT